MNFIETRELMCLLGDQPLFEDLSFTIGPGEAVRLKGNNGSGKSTFLRCLIGAQAANRGSVFMNGRDMETLSPLERELSAPLVDQAPLLNWDVPAIDNLVDSVTIGPNLRNWFFTSRRAIRKRVLKEHGELVEKFGLDTIIERSTRELSIGQRRLLMLLRALRARDNGEPRTLLLDEPLAGLRADRISAVLSELQKKLDSGWAVIVAEHVEEIEQLKPRHLMFPYRKNQTNPEADSTDAGTAGHSLTNSSLRETLLTDTSRPPLLKLTKVSAGYPAVVEPIVPDVSLEVHRSGITAVVGPNAAGKSTLFRGLFADEQTKAWIRGKIEWDGNPICHVRDRRHVASDRVAWIPQERFNFPRMTVKETLRGALNTSDFRGLKSVVDDLLGKLRKEEQSRRIDILELVSRLHEKRPDGRTILEGRWETLSGGERAIATVALGLVNLPTVVFLDEPAANLDVHAMASLKKILLNYVDQQQAGCLLIEHRTVFLEGLADSVFTMANAWEKIAVE